METVNQRLTEIDEVFSVVVVPGSPEIIISVNGPNWTAVEAVVAERIGSIPGVARHRLSVCGEVRKYVSGAGDLKRPLGPSLALVRQDKLDEQLIEMLVQDARISNRAIGRRIGISEAGVRLRLKRLSERGVIRIGVVCEPDHLGFDDAAFIFFKGHLRRSTPLWTSSRTGRK